ncbi:MAG: F0F1 ATP synthase subunit epsilon [Thermincolia bacterium]
MAAIRLEIVTPERVVFSEDVDFIVAPGSDGYLGVLANHAPLITSLEIGELRAKQGNQEMKMAISGGFFEVKSNKAVVLADSAEKATEIDLDRARRAKERAEQRLAAKTADVDLTRVEAALKRALIRIKVAGK